MATKRVTIQSPPTVERDGDFLVWPMEGITERRVGPRIVDDFAAVDSPDAALYFARRYGTVLPLHSQITSGDSMREGIRTVLALAVRIRAMLEANASLVKNHLPALPVLEVFFGDTAPSQQRRKKSAISTIRYLMANELQALISYCNLRPAFEWDANEHRWTVGWTDLPEAPIMRQWFSCALSAVVAFIAQAFAAKSYELEPEPDAVCAACGEPFTARRIQEGRASYCPKCQGTPAMWRHIKRRQRAGQTPDGKTAS